MMKKIVLTSVAMAVFGIFAACKGNNADNDAANEADTTVVAPTDMETDETMDATTVNDSNASGTTSGTMEQVP